MRHVFSKYGFTILTALGICVLLSVAPKLGKDTNDSMHGLINNISQVTESGLENVILPSTLGYKPKDVVKIENKKYVILQDKGEDKYLVMDIDGIGERRFDDTSNIYNGSNLDNYLNGEYYELLPERMKSSIVETSIMQKFYTRKVNPKYRWVDRSNPNYNGCTTGCILQEDGTWAKYDTVQPIKGENGAYIFDGEGALEDAHGNKSELIRRKIFAPSIDEVKNIININDQWEMDKFTRNSHGTLMYTIFRDGSYDLNNLYVSAHYMLRSLCLINIDINYNVRPTFVIDLKAYNGLI